MISKILNNTVLLHQTTPCPLSFKQMARKADPTIYPLHLNNKHRQQQTISNKQKAEPFSFKLIATLAGDHAHFRGFHIRSIDEETCLATLNLS